MYSPLSALIGPEFVEHGRLTRFKRVEGDGEADPREDELVLAGPDDKPSRGNARSAGYVAGFINDSVRQ